MARLSTISPSRAAELLESSEWITEQDLLATLEPGPDRNVEELTAAGGAPDLATFKEAWGALMLLVSRRSSPLGRSCATTSGWRAARRMCSRRHRPLHRSWRFRRPAAGSGATRRQPADRPRDAPTNRALVHRELRFDRNRYAITAEEQRRLLELRVAVAGLSVGRAVVSIMAHEGIGGELRLADFDVLDLSNLNRVSGGVADVGESKVVLAAREVAELDPYVRVVAFPRGVEEATIADFVAGADVIVDECDDLAVKLQLREHARAARRPVVMPRAIAGCSMWSASISSRIGRRSMGCSAASQRPSCVASRPSRRSRT